ncbi:MAG: flagellar basal body rod protein FlgC [Anaeromusa sp.]|jgi:flagellar basal-body rod protein FlgC|uniref:flagellar basal body rod protein FlgC n=1 Tax=Anaeromusa sp. TaxID=1872520 RepID=UPI00261239E7|nr:flagellar basal body rod protein FlgC [Anaeromusa sp.]MDD3157526.1 flagellar basal body rod protein FlgC [Anaeromusa sp.]MEA4834293.1 flagellar basal body rod protein FlgC [Anaeromusa sp.]
MSLFSAIDAAGSGLTAERLRMDVISNNLANVNSTRTVAGGPYRRQVVVFAPREGEQSFGRVLQKEMGSNAEGVRAVGITEDASPFRTVYEPQHPDADANGYVRLPNVNVVAEMVDMITASRAYEANVTSINTAKSMMAKALEIGK